MWVGINQSPTSISVEWRHALFPWQPHSANYWWGKQSPVAYSLLFLGQFFTNHKTASHYWDLRSTYMCRIRYLINALSVSPPVSIIANRENAGFLRACALRADGREPIKTHRLRKLVTSSSRTTVQCRQGIRWRNWAFAWVTTLIELTHLVALSHHQSSKTRVSNDFHFRSADCVRTAPWDNHPVRKVWFYRRSSSLTT